jgi:prepilin-type N-terminal cleavage/methylation domain-containing protein
MRMIHPAMTHRCRKDAASSAFTLVEVLIALAIASVVLVATAVATNGLIKQYKGVQSEGAAALATRSALDRMRVLLQTCNGVARPYTAAKVTSFQNGSVTTDTGFEVTVNNTFLTPAVAYTYRFYLDPGDSTTLLCASGPAGNVGSPYPIIRGVAKFSDGTTPAFRVTMTPKQSWASVRAGGFRGDQLQSAMIELAVGDSRPSTAASASANVMAVESDSSAQVGFTVMVAPRGSNPTGPSLDLSIGATQAATNHFLP